MNHKYQIEEDTLKQILQEYDIFDFTWKQAKGGADNTTIFINIAKSEFVIRVYRNNSRTDGQIIEEVEFVNFCLEHGIAVTKILPNVKRELLTKIIINDFFWQVVLMSKIDGSEVDSKNWSKDKELMRNIAQTQAKLHLAGVDFAKVKSKNQYVPNVAASGIGLFLNAKLKQIEILKIADQEINTIVDQIKVNSQSYPTNLPFGYVHDDIYWRNLIVNPSKQISIIDFGDLRVGPLVGCLGRSLFSTLLSALDNELDVKDCCLRYMHDYNQVRPIQNLEITELIKSMLLCSNTYLAAEILQFKEAADIKKHLKLKEIITNLNLN